MDHGTIGLGLIYCGTPSGFKICQQFTQCALRDTGLWNGTALQFLKDQDKAPLVQAEGIKRSVVLNKHTEPKENLFEFFVPS